MYDFLIASYLYRLSDLIKITDSDNYRSKAFFKAALAVDGYGKSIYDAYKNGSLKKIPSNCYIIKDYIA